MAVTDVAIETVPSDADHVAVEPVEQFVRIAREKYPEIIQAVRWMDEDNGTPHFVPEVGFVVDDPDGLQVPLRWLPHLDVIERALADLDHAMPHPLDIDVIDWLAREGKSPTIYEAAVRCFVTGEHTPVQAMAHSTPELWAANLFFNEYFEGWSFNPTAGFRALPPRIMIEIVERLRAISPGDWYGYDRYQAGKFEAGFLLDRGQEPELREFARLNASGLAEQIGNILARAHEAADLIETLTAENKRLRKLLKPFAEACSGIDKRDPSAPDNMAALRPDFDWYAAEATGDLRRHCVTVADLRAARAANGDAS